MKLDADKVLNKKFSINLKGYDTHEVDSFLDLVIEDYQKFKKNWEEQNQKINELTLIKEKLKEEIQLKDHRLNALTKQIQILESKGLSNMDLLKRVNKLEENNK